MVNRIVAVYCEHALDSWMLRVRAAAQGIWTSLVILVLLNWNLNISG